MKFATVAALTGFVLANDDATCPMTLEFFTDDECKTAAEITDEEKKAVKVIEDAWSLALNAAVKDSKCVAYDKAAVTASLLKD